ncbi:MAG TPA: hypothetical protein VME43_12910 [Bryobacteraceae bacterium]|nr:hypothetical protein [Bryobacteraceae bacterium]
MHALDFKLTRPFCFERARPEKRDHKKAGARATREERFVLPAAASPAVDIETLTKVMATKVMALHSGHALRSSKRMITG